MDLEDQRVFLRRVERRRLDDPALDLRVAGRGVLDLFDLRELLARSSRR